MTSQFEGMSMRKKIGCGVIALLIGGWSGSPAAAQDELDLLDQVLVDMKDQSRIELADRVRELEIENGALRERLLLLEKNVSGTDAVELERENEALREALRLLHKQTSEKPSPVAPEEEENTSEFTQPSSPAQPVPQTPPSANPELLELNEITYVVRRGETISTVSQKFAVSMGDVVLWNRLADARLWEGQRLKLFVSDPGGVPSDSAFRIVKEWGRSPEVTASMPGDVASLKGMSIYVDPRLTEQELRSLGRNYHERFKDYDNINVEFFDDAQAARDFADTGRASPGSRVLSISKHKKSNRDVIIIFRDGQAIELP